LRSSLWLSSAGDFSAGISRRFAYPTILAFVISSVLRVRHVRFANVKVSCRYIDRGATETARAPVARLRRQRQAGVIHGAFPSRPGALAAILDEVGLGALKQVVFPCGFKADAGLIEA
jgi:hypothetical protein